MKFKKTVSLLLAMTMALSTVGCAAASSTSQATQEKPQSTASAAQDGKTVNGVDISETVNLIGYLVGDAPAGMQEVVDALNEKYMKDINTTIELRHIPMADLTAKYPMILATGEDVDFVFSANWMNYAAEAAKGAFRPLTMEDFEVRMPRINEAIQGTPALNDVKVNGEMYMIPSPAASDGVPVFVIREDLRKKYNVPEVNTVADLEPYLAAIKANEPDMMPINCDNGYDLIAGPEYIVDNSLGSYKQDFFQATGSGSGLFWGVGEDYRVYSYKDPDVRERLKQTTTILKGWADKGYINQDYFANKVPSRDSFAQGKSGVAFGNCINIQATLNTAQSNGWETKVILGTDKNGHVHMPSYTNNGISIAANSENAERVMLAMDLMMQDYDYNMLSYFGIEGKNYVLDKDGKVALPEGVTAETNTYPPDAAGIWFTNLYQFPPMASWSDEYAALRAKVRAGGVMLPTAMLSMNVDTTNVKTEVANVGNVMIQYFQPMRMGMVDNVDKAIDELISKLDAAGYDTLNAEITKQVEAYKATKQ